MSDKWQHADNHWPPPSQSPEKPIRWMEGGGNAKADVHHRILGGFIELAEAGTDKLTG